MRAPTGTKAEAVFAKNPQCLLCSGHTTSSIRYACFKNRPVVCVPHHPETHTDSPLQVWQSCWLHTGSAVGLCNRPVCGGGREASHHSCSWGLAAPLAFVS